MIPIKIKTTGAVLLNEEVQSYVHEKVQKLSKYIDDTDTTALMEVELEALPKKTGENFRTEFNFSSNGKVLRMEAKGETLHASIDGAVEEASRRLRHLKDKHTDVMRRAGAEIKEFFRRLGDF